MRAAFAEIVDYAGLFPPAACSMADAVRQYDDYRHSGDRWMLGRFVVAAIRLQELGAALAAGGAATHRSDPWRLSVIMGANVPAELALIGAFAAEWESHGVFADAIEYRVSSVGEVRVAAEQIPVVFRRYFEVPHLGPYPDLVQAIGEIGAFAKLRTGGSTPDLFPPAGDVTKFLAAAVRHRVRFKATAGLHHPWHGDYPISYEPDAPRQSMHGFVNLLVAVAHLMRGGNDETARLILDEADLHAFARDDGTIRWRHERYSEDDLAAAHDLFVGFGSCSFREPVDELGLGVAA